MTTLKGGIQLVPPLPASLAEHLGGGSEISEIIAYRNKLIETRNAQLEYQGNITGLHTKIRDACRNLSKKDSNIKCDIETLAMERGRLAYLRDELARRADVISRWEARVREGKSKPIQVNEGASAENQKRRDRDRMNAILVEMDQRCKREAMAASLETNNSSSDMLGGIMSNEQVGKVAIAKITPVSEAIGSDVINMYHQYVDTDDLLDSDASHRLTRDSRGYGLESSSIGESQPSRLFSKNLSGSEASARNPPPLGASTEIEEGPAPRPYPAWVGGASQDQFFEDLTVCLDYLWREYSTDIGEEGDRLMTLPNLLRLAGDADFDLDTQILIELFLRTVKLGKNCLVEKQFFLALLQAAVTVRIRKPMDSIQTTDFLFSDYLFPLMHRLKMKERIMSSRHPPLPRSPLASSSGLSVRYSN